MKTRPADFWDRYESNIYMLERVLERLKARKEIVQLSESLVQSVRSGEVLAIEFLPDLIRFCQKIVEWFDAPRLLTLDSSSLVSLRKIIKTVKTALERFKPEIVEPNFIDRDPLEFYNIHLTLIQKCYSEFMGKVAVHVRSLSSTAQSTSSSRTAGNNNVKRERQDLSSTDEEDVKMHQFLTGANFDSSDDETSPPARFTRTFDADEEDKKPTLEEISILPPTLSSSVSVNPQRSEIPSSIPSQRNLSSSVAEHDDRIEHTPVTANSAPFRNDSNRAISEIALDHHETHQLPLPTQVKVEDEEPEQPESLVGRTRESIIVSHVLDSQILSDLWISHQLVENFEQFKFPNNKQEFKFQLENIAHLTFPRTLPQSSFSVEEEEEQKVLPRELVFLFNLHIQNDQPFTQIKNFFKFKINGSDLAIRNFRQVGSSIKLVIPIHPVCLKRGSNKIELRRMIDNPGVMAWEGQASVEEVTMMSEREMFEKGIQMACPSRRTIQLFESSQREIHVHDPIHQTLITCPVRGSECNHLRCFDLQAFIQRHRFESSWSCPIETCKQSCKPVELEFDDWMFRNIQNAVDNGLV